MLVHEMQKARFDSGLFAFLNKEPRRKQRGILKTTLSYFTPQEAGNITHRDSRTSEKKKTIAFGDWQ